VGGGSEGATRLELPRPGGEARLEPGALEPRIPGGLASLKLPELDDRETSAPGRGPAGLKPEGPAPEL